MYIPFFTLNFTLQYLFLIKFLYITISNRKGVKMNFLQSFDWMLLIRCFIVGGLICVIGQILIDKTKLTPARILVTFVTLGTILGGLGIYKYLVNFAGCGATVPLLGFGNNLAKGAIEAVKQDGILGAFTGGLKASAGGIAAAVFFGYIASLISKPKMKKQ
jgi:stage V sporulation protein AE